METTNGALPKDDDGASIQDARGFITNDSSDTPKTSPFSLTGGVDTLVTPRDATLSKNGVDIVLYPVAHDMLVSEDPTMTQYTTVKAGTSEVFSIYGMSAIYVQGTAADTLNFRYNVI